MAITYRIEQEGKHDFVIIRTDPDGTQKKISRHGDVESAKARKIRLLSTPGMKTSSEKRNAPQNTQKEEVQTEGSMGFNRLSRRFRSNSPATWRSGSSHDKPMSALVKKLKYKRNQGFMRMVKKTAVEGTFAEGSGGIQRIKRLYAALRKKGMDKDTKWNLRNKMADRVIRTRKEDVQVEGSMSQNRLIRKMNAIGKSIGASKVPSLVGRSNYKSKNSDDRFAKNNKVQEGSSGHKRNQRVYKALSKKGADVSGEKMASHDVRANDRAYSAIKRREKGKQMESENLDPSLTISEEIEISEGYSACKMGDGRCAVMNTGPDGKKTLVTRKKTLQGAKDHAAKLAAQAKTKKVQEAFGSSLEATLFVEKNENSGKYELRKRLGEGSGDDTGGCSVVVGIFENVEKANVKLEELVQKQNEKKLREEIDSTLFLEDVVEILESEEFTDAEKEEILEAFEMDLLESEFSSEELNKLEEIFESTELSEEEKEEFWNGLYEKRTFSKFHDRKSRPAGGHKQRVPFVRPGQKMTGADYRAAPHVSTGAAEKIRQSLAGGVDRYKKITRMAESEDSNSYDTASLKARMKINKDRIQAKKKEIEKAKDLKAPYSGTLAKLGKPVKVAEEAESFEELSEEDILEIERILESNEISEEEKSELAEELSEYFSVLDESKAPKSKAEKFANFTRKVEKWAKSGKARDYKTAMNVKR